MSISIPFLAITNKYKYLLQYQSVLDFFNMEKEKSDIVFSSLVYDKYLTYMEEHPYEDIRPNIDPVSELLIDDTTILVGQLHPIQSMEFNIIIQTLYHEYLLTNSTNIETTNE